MSKELRELLQSLEEQKSKVRGFLAEDKVNEAESLMEEVRDLQKKVALQQELEAAESYNLDDATPLNSNSDTDKDLESEYKRVFLKGYVDRGSLLMITVLSINTKQPSTKVGLAQIQMEI
jgi:HK97 family phage major capsid protein